MQENSTKTKILILFCLLPLTALAGNIQLYLSDQPKIGAELMQDTKPVFLYSYVEASGAGGYVQLIAEPKLTEQFRLHTELRTTFQTWELFLGYSILLGDFNLQANIQTLNEPYLLLSLLFFKVCHNFTFDVIIEGALGSYCTFYTLDKIYYNVTPSLGIGIAVEVLYFDVWEVKPYVFVRYSF